MNRRRHPLEGLFALLALALPAPVRRRDGDAMRMTLHDHLHATQAPARRLWIAARAILRLLPVIVVEWLEASGIKKSPSGHGPNRKRGRDGMGSLIRNVRYALRSLRKAPTFTWATILLVGLGVGAVTAVFTVVDGVLLRALPYPAAERLVYMTNGAHNGATLRRMDDVEAFDAWTATSGQTLNLTRPGSSPIRMRGVETTPSFFSMFGARPHLGRLLVESDRNNTAIAVVTWQAWQDIWGSDPDLVGSTVTLDDQAIEIVGVLNRELVLPRTLVGSPVHLFRNIDWTSPNLDEGGYHAHSIVARLGPNVSLETGDLQLDQVGTEVQALFPDDYPERPDWPLVSLHEQTVGDVKSGLFTLLGAVGLLLLVACANVAHLFMARGISRGREMAIRRALGARTGNLLGQLSAESLAVGIGGGLLGLGLGKIALVGFSAWTADLPRSNEIALDGRILVFAAGLATATALIFGLIPAIRTLGGDVQDSLRGSGQGVSGGRSIRALRSGLIIAEVAVSLVLVSSAGLLMKSFMTVASRDTGMEVADVLLVPLNPANVASADDYRTRMGEVMRAISEVPGVRAVSYGMEAPFEFVGGESCCWRSRYTPVDEPESNPIGVMMHASGGDFFGSFGTELVAGSVWGVTRPGDTPTPSVISQALAIRLFGSAEAAVGKELAELGSGMIVTGVAEPTLHYGLDQAHDNAVYMPIEALPFPLSRVTFAIRTDPGSEALAGPIREAIWSAEPNLPVPTVETLVTWIERSSAARRFGSMLFSTFGVLALVLAAAGLYGTLLYSVSQQRKELGIRLALGAGRGRVQSAVVRRGFVHSVIGVGVGLVVAWYSGRVLESFLYGVEATDLGTLAISAVILMATAVVASWVPAWRAGRTDPLETLKVE